MSRKVATFSSLSNLSDTLQVRVRIARVRPPISLSHSHVRALSNHHFLSEALFVCVLLLLFLFWRHENAERTKHNERERVRERGHCQKLVLAFGQISGQNINIYVFYLNN